MNRPNVALGDIAKDTISGFQGVVVATTDWLNGCKRITIQPMELKDGKPIDSFTFDVEQIQVVEAGPKIVSRMTGGDRDDRSAISRN